jgi:hypothetical protein
MRLATAVILAALVGLAAAQLPQLPALPQLPLPTIEGPAPGFPAGVPQANNPLAFKAYIPATLTATQYRGTYVSAAGARGGGRVAGGGSRRLGAARRFGAGGSRPTRRGLGPGSNPPPAPAQPRDGASPRYACAC